MAYKGKIEEQKEFTIEDLEKRLEFLESQITDEVAKKISGRTIYLLYPELYSANHFVNTTVSDVLNVFNNVFDVCWASSCSMFGNLTFYNLRLAKPKEHRGVLKFTPKNTLTFEHYFVGKTKEIGGVQDIVLLNRLPILQKETFLKEICADYFNTDEVNADWDFVEKNAFSMLSYDKRFASGTIEYSPNHKNIAEEYSQICQEMVSSWFDIANSWAITYLYKNILFLIPIRQEFFKKLFKDREKGENGRRNFVPTIVNSHEKNNGTSVHSHLRVGGSYLKIHGREFSFVIGAEDFEKIFPNTEYNKKKLLKMKKNGIEEGEYLLLDGKKKQF